MGCFPMSDHKIESFFQRKKFEIRGVNWSQNEKFVYYTSSDEKSKHLLSLCKVTHQHSMAIQSRLAQVRGREESGNPLRRKLTEPR